MTVQHNRPRFDLGSNRELILPSPARILLGNGLQSEGLELTHVGDEQVSNIQEANSTKPPEPYFQVNGIFVPGNTETAGVIELVQAGDANIRYGQQEKPSFSFEEVLHNDLGKIIKLEADNTSIEDIKAYFGRLEGLIQLYDKDFRREKRVHDRDSLSPLVMNRETFKEETYYPLKEFSLNLNSLEQLENIVLKSLKVECESKSSPAKRFALRFLTNTVFIEDFKSEKITEAVIQGLKIDREPAAKKIYEHYLTTQLENLESSQKEEIIDALNKNSRLSSHLAQSLFLAEPSLKERVETKEFPQVNNFEDLEKILQNLYAYSKVAMNQVDLLPPQINLDANYGIEIEVKLPGMVVHTDGNLCMRERLKPYADFIELGIDFGLWDPVTQKRSETEGEISELRTLSGGFKLNEENQRKLFEIVNIFHESPDLMLFLSQHVHVDKSNINPLALLSLIQNENKVTLETKYLDLDTTQLNPNNNLVYSYQAPNLIDQMIVLEELKNVALSPEALAKSFELSDQYKISISMAQVMLAAVQEGKGYLLPNLLRLNSEGKNYLKSSYIEDGLMFAVHRDNKVLAKFIVENLPADELVRSLSETNSIKWNPLMNAIILKCSELPKLIIEKCPKDDLVNLLTQVDKDQNNALMLAVIYSGSVALELIMQKCPKDKLVNLLTETNNSGRSAFVSAFGTYAQRMAELIIENLPEDELLESFIRTSKDDSLMLALRSGSPKIIQRIESLPEDKLMRLLTETNKDNKDTLRFALNSGSLKIAKLAMNNLPKEELVRFLTEVDQDGNNALMHALSSGSLRMAELIKSQLSGDQWIDSLTQVNEDGNNTLMLAASSGNKATVEFTIENFPQDKLEMALIKINRHEENALMLIKPYNSGAEEVAELITSKL